MNINMGIAGRLTSDLMRDFGLSRTQAIGFTSNLAHESNNFKDLQEKNPVVPGSRGGFGFGQWTGSRRREFENWASKRGLNLRSYEANYGFLKHELENTREKSVLGKLKEAKTVVQAAKIVMNEFLRPGIPHWDSRKAYAEKLDKEFDETLDYTNVLSYRPDMVVDPQPAPRMFEELMAQGLPTPTPSPDVISPAPVAPVEKASLPDIAADLPASPVEAVTRSPLTGLPTALAAAPVGAVQRGSLPAVPDPLAAAVESINTAAARGLSLPGSAPSVPAANPDSNDPRGAQVASTPGAAAVSNALPYDPVGNKLGDRFAPTRPDTFDPRGDQIASTPGVQPGPDKNDPRGNQIASTPGALPAPTQESIEQSRRSLDVTDEEYARELSRAGLSKTEIALAMSQRAAAKPSPIQAKPNNVAPVAVPAPPLSPPKTIASNPVAEVAKAPATPPPASAMDFWAGKATEAVASDGTKLGYDALGRQTRTMANGYTEVKGNTGWAPQHNPNFDPNVSLLAGLPGLSGKKGGKGAKDSAKSNSGKGVSIDKEKAMGMLALGAVGFAVGGLPGAAVGARLGSKFGGKQNSYPDAPVPGQRSFSGFDQALIDSVFGPSPSIEEVGISDKAREAAKSGKGGLF